VIEDSAFLYNTSDGLDLLYHTLGGSIIVQRTIAEGNAGDQIKTAGTAYIENAIAVSNCGFFDGKPYTDNVDNCRAGGSSLAFNLSARDRITVVNSTVTGEGDCLLIAECVGGEICTGAESILLRNSIFHGHSQLGVEGDTTCLGWTNLPGEPLTFDRVLINGVKGAPIPCPANSLCGISPGMVNARIDSFDARLADGSPAIDAGTVQGAPVDDFEGRLRDRKPDMGAYERRDPVARLYLPLTATPGVVPQVLCSMSSEPWRFCITTGLRKPR
jgi:hypothetical protein